MISVTDAYQLVRRWNAKECYLVHYRGLMDFEEGKNQWFRGPVKPMTSAELQTNIDSHLGLSGDNGRFRITVAKEGMIWTPDETPRHSYDESIPIGNIIEIEALQKYTFKIKKENREDKLKVTIEDRINRYTLQFDRPRRDKNNNQLIHAAAERGLLARGGIHNDDARCNGTALIGGIHEDGSVGWKKEIWFTGGYTDELAKAKVANSLLGRWIGWKVVMYNINNNTAVKMESYLDDNNTNHWVRVTNLTDNGGWYADTSDKKFYSAGAPKTM